jgi:DNA-binding NarL/FixJ family response regulator
MPIENTMMPLRLLIVDDSLLFLGTLRRLFESVTGIDVVGLATSGFEAIELVERVRPDAVLTDLSMPKMDGLETARLLAVRPRKPIIVVMSIHDLPSYRQAAHAAGADAFITKSDLMNKIQPLLNRLINRSKSDGSKT